MVSHEGPPPLLLPVLARGKHRNPRMGACFMEFASLLAGERWTDHPACTHPLLAAVARHVNDYTSDLGRPRLVGLIPSVIGLVGDDPHIDPRIALRCATAALPVVSADRQRVMAASVLAAERVLNDLDGLPPGTLREESRQALDRAPHASAWAGRFSNGIRTSGRHFRKHAAPGIVHDAVEGIARACVPDPDEGLHALLVAAIEECAVWVDRDPDRDGQVDPARWATACRLTRGSRALEG